MQSITRLKCFEKIFPHLVQNEVLDTKICIPLTLYINDKNKGSHCLLTSNFRFFLVSKTYEFTVAPLLHTKLQSIDKEKRIIKVISQGAKPNVVRYYLNKEDKIVASLNKIYHLQFKSLMQQTFHAEPEELHIQKRLLTSNKQLNNSFKMNVINNLIPEEQFWNLYTSYKNHLIMPIEQEALARNVSMLMKEVLPLYREQEASYHQNVNYYDDIQMNLEMDNEPYQRSRPPKKKDIKLREQQFENCREWIKINQELGIIYIKSFGTEIINNFEQTPTSRNMERILDSNFYDKLQLENDGYQLQEKQSPPSREKKNSVHKQKNKNASKQWEQEKLDILRNISTTQIKQPILKCESKPVYPDEFRFRLEEKDREFFRELSIYADEIKHKLQCLYSNMELNQKEDTLKEHMKQEGNKIRVTITNDQKVNKPNYQIAIKEDLQKFIEKAYNQV